MSGTPFQHPLCQRQLWAPPMFKSNKVGTPGRTTWSGDGVLKLFSTCCMYSLLQPWPPQLAVSTLKTQCPALKPTWEKTSPRRKEGFHRGVRQTKHSTSCLNYAPEIWLLLYSSYPGEDSSIIAASSSAPVSARKLWHHDFALGSHFLCYVGSRFLCGLNSYW